MVFAEGLDQVVLGITNAFGNGAYHGKRFVDSQYDYVKRDQKWVGMPVTNSWHLSEGLPLTLLPRGKKMVAYDEGFVVEAKAVNRGSTEVSVRPTGSWTREPAYGLSMHLSRTLVERGLLPLPLETTNLFQRIERQLVEIRAGQMAPLPPTPDTRSDYYRRFWTEMTVEEKHDPRNWDKMVQAWRGFQVGHNPQGGANGRQPSGSETNRTSAAAASRRSP
jgi:hypothetical protein